MNFLLDEEQKHEFVNSFTFTFQNSEDEKCFDIDDLKKQLYSHIFENDKHLKDNEIKCEEAYDIRECLKKPKTKKIKIKK